MFELGRKKGIPMKNEKEEVKADLQPTRRKRSAIFVMLLFLILVHLLLNHDMLSVVLNAGTYQPVQATVTKETSDEFLLLLPKVELTYIYEGNGYATDEYFILQPLFGLEAVPGTKLEILVNQYSPEFIIIKTNFWANKINWIVLFFELLGIGYLIKHRKRPNIFKRMWNRGKEWKEKWQRRSERKSKKI